MIGIWIPDLRESTDGLPLATKISDLFLGFPYDRVPENWILQLVLHPGSVFAMLAFYLVSKPLFQQIAKLVDPKATWFIVSIAEHNFLLAVFSLVVVINSWPIVIDHYQRYVRNRGIVSVIFFLPDDRRCCSLE